MGGAWIFLRGLKLCGESRTQQVFLVSKIKIWDNHAFFRDNKAPIWKKTRHILLFIPLLTKIIVAYLSLKMPAHPQFSFWILIALAKICFPRIVKTTQNTISHRKRQAMPVACLTSRTPVCSSINAAREGNCQS